VGRDQLARTPQAQLPAAALRPLDHEANRPVEVAVLEGGHRVQGAETQQPVGSGAADIGAVVVVGADVL
jgi:hypothetical protein